jgi:hypothetical protein
MTPIANCPLGFEDGQIIAYRGELSLLEVTYEFWNERTGRLIFEGFIGMRDSCAVGVTVSSIRIVQPSKLVDTLMHRLFEHPPEGIDLRHFQFLDLDDHPMFEVVAKKGSFLSS